ncbi:hypothetical protein BKA70DRAFT_1440519 [Coprinopsis sp. MPI-PUGE-AT-0042]|nr:hypothetical protein BKA70DRAFT_1440519 [Coprinopsis sp. MPI-PUGE-AT-0042]
MLVVVTLLLSLVSFSLGQRTASVTLYSTNQCCGGSVTYNGVTEDRCILNANSWIFGKSVTIDGLYDGTFSYGVLTAFNESGCVSPFSEIPGPGCYSFLDTSRGPASLSWKEIPPTIPPLRRGNVDISREGFGTRTVAEEDCKGPDYCTYFDERELMSKGVALNGSLEKLDTVMALVQKRDWGLAPET